MIVTYRRVFNTILALIYFPDLDRRFERETGDPVYDLYNPISKACFSMLWMYSLEPPLYNMLNKACRNRIKALLPILGPFACAISSVLDGAERAR